MLIRLEKITVVGEFTYFRISAKNKTEIIYKLSVYKEMYRVCITVRFFELYCDGLCSTASVYIISYQSYISQLGYPQTCCYLFFYFFVRNLKSIFFFQ